MRRWTPTLLTLIVLFGCTSMAVAQARRSKDGPATSQSKTTKATRSAKSSSAQPKQKRSKKPASPKSRSAVVITPKTEAVALGFARQHHQELADLLRQMKLNKNKRSIVQYSRAVRQISAARDKLERIKQRSPDRYLLELQRWKLDSRIRLLAARMIMSKDGSLEEELRDLLLERTNIRLQQLKQERERLEKYLDRAGNRLKRIEQDIELNETDPEAAAQKDFKQIIKSLRTYTPKAKKPARNKKNSKKTNKNTKKSQSNTKASSRKPSSRKR